ncbi:MULTISPECIES: LysR substrate-binding domain-containing protein [unclassified Mesorhizobium]|uniref:LysR substrate-binding domain-containing protein n=1 Tax=unclassified Mesorhizobium TaxID=325217 RepID=UPI001926AE57|nr:MULTISPECIES: LysR substrate-binding domain-containing protein [unclassified Mesorhizobium]
MKRGRLPLTALRSFEAAGRHLSFSRAAEELFVSQAAISRQVRELEAFVGHPLFERLHRRVELTEIGYKLIDRLTRSLDEIDHCLSEIQATPMQSLVKVSVEPSFAGSWLVPRLNQFRTLRPDIDVSVDVDPQLVEFRTHEAEIAIRHSLTERSWPRTQSVHLFDTSVTPVLCPALLASGPPLMEPADLRHYTLLHEENRDGWLCWFEEAGMAEASPARGPIFPDGALAAQAALLGHGVALIDPLMVSRELREEDLVQPFEVEVPWGAYWLVAPDLAALSEPASAFAAWLKEELGVAQAKPT